MTTSPGGAPAKPEGPRFRDAMPRPVMVLFAALGIFTLVATGYLLLRPPRFESVAVEDRRPPPRTPHSHDPTKVISAPLPRGVEPVVHPCGDAGEVKIMGGPDGVARLKRILDQACDYAGPGVPPELRTAIRGLAGATVQFGVFERTGVESTVDFSTRTLYLNGKFASTKIETRAVVPVVAHDAWHLAHERSAVTAREELAARRVELAACRQAIPIADWPRWCLDAQRIVELPEATAAALLVRAGYQA